MTSENDQSPSRRPRADETQAREEAVPEEEVVSGEPVEEDEASLLRRTEAVYFRRGPYPEAREVERYDQVLPGAADRIFTMAESEVGHRHDTERLGQYIGAGIAILGLVGGFTLIAWGHDVAGVAFTVSGIAPIVYAFLRTGQRGGRNS